MEGVAGIVDWSQCLPPGKPYEEWKKTKEYEAWQKKTDALMKGN